MTGFDVIIAGAGHNGLVAANYLAKAGKKVLILEAQEIIGGATQSVKAFEDYEARLSRYSYLIALLPDKIIKDLNLNFRVLSREISSFSPYEDGGLLVSRSWDQRTAESFKQLTGSEKEAQAWQDFYGEVAQFASRIAPSMLEPLKSSAQLKTEIAMPQLWDQLIEQPIGNVITQRFKNDLVRGVVLTDALIGTLSSAYGMQANNCFLYHLIGNGTGLAGLRALLKERISQHKYANWLIFGERNAAFDSYYPDELTAWQQQGMLQANLVFSRDNSQRRYVQDQLRDKATQLRAWLDKEAAIYVCGSLEGMAGGVDTALRDIIGNDGLQQLAAEGRYRRDVY